MGQTKTFRTQSTLGCTQSTYVNHHDNILRGFETQVFTGQRPFSSN